MSRINGPTTLLRGLHGGTSAILLQRLGNNRGQQAEGHLHSLTWTFCTTGMRKFAQSEQGDAHVFSRTLDRYGRGSRYL